jgi:hypothetical protein
MPTFSSHSNLIASAGLTHRDLIIHKLHNPGLLGFMLKQSWSVTHTCPDEEREQTVVLDVLVACVTPH